MLHRTLVLPERIMHCSAWLAMFRVTCQHLVCGNWQLDGSFWSLQAPKLEHVIVTAVALQKVTTTMRFLSTNTHEVFE